MPLFTAGHFFQFVARTITAIDWGIPGVIRLIDGIIGKIGAAVIVVAESIGKGILGVTAV